jgi:hypothetical protein
MMADEGWTEGPPGALHHKVNTIFKRLAKSNEFELKNALTHPIHKDLPLGANGICIMIATVGCGKTYNYLKLATKQQYLFEQPFFETIVICSTSGEFDKIVFLLKPGIARSTLISIKDEELMDWLNEYKKKVLLYNTIMEFVRNEFKNPSEEMLKIIMEHRLRRDPRRLLRYIATTLEEIGWTTYPHRLLLILDDFASHPMLKSKDMPLSRELKKLRHFNINVIVCVQTVKSIPKDIKRIASDIIIFPGISEFDFKELIRESTASCFNFKILWHEYSKIKCPRTMMRLHVSARRVIITPPSG